MRLFGPASPWVVGALVLIVAAALLLLAGRRRGRRPDVPADVDEPAGTGTSGTDEAPDPAPRPAEPTGPIDAAGAPTVPMPVVPGAVTAPRRSAPRHAAPEPPVARAPGPPAVPTTDPRDDPSPTLPVAGADVGRSAVRWLRQGRPPADVASAHGVDERELAGLVAGALGLVDARGRQVGSSRTVEPGRAWANAGSAPGSTTPTTG